ncbi:MAG: hypothetical protein WB777_09775, partial [Mycobacterium sp.]
MGIAALTGFQRFANVVSGGIFVPAICGDRGSHGQTDECGEVTTELPCPFHGVVGNQGRFGQVSTPNPLKHHVEADEEQLGFFAAFHTFTPDREHLFLGAVEFARPTQQHRALNA